MITLLFTFGIFAKSFAQFNYGQDNRGGNYAYDQRDHFDRDNFNPARVRDFQIQKINNDFASQIQAIQNNCYMGRHEKRKAIRTAEFERSRQIEIVNAKFDSFRFYHNRHDRDWNNRQDNW